MPFIAVAAAAAYGDKDVLLLFPNETRNLRPPRSDLTSMLSLALSIRDDDGSDDNDDDDDDDIDAGDRIAESLSFFTATLLPLPPPLPLPLRALICSSAAVARSYRFSSTHASNSAARAVHSRFGNGGAHGVERASTIGANADDDDAATEAAAAAARRLACRAEIDDEDDEEDDCEHIEPFQPDECMPNSASLIDVAAAEAAVAAAEVAAVAAASAAYARGLQVSASHSAAHAAASSTRKSARHARNSRSMADKATACRVRPSSSALTRICEFIPSNLQQKRTWANNSYSKTSCFLATRSEKMEFGVAGEIGNAYLRYVAHDALQTAVVRDRVATILNSALGPSGRFKSSVSRMHRRTRRQR